MSVLFNFDIAQVPKERIMPTITQQVKTYFSCHVNAIDGASRSMKERRSRKMTLGLRLFLVVAWMWSAIVPGFAQNLVVNGSFEQPALPNATFAFVTNAMPPWKTTNEALEVWSDGVILSHYQPAKAVVGRQFLEVNARKPAGNLWQDVPTTVGELYTFSFYHSPRPGFLSMLTVSLNSQIVATFSEDGISLNDHKWIRFSTNVTATTTNLTLMFSDVSPTGDGAGAHLDLVVLERLVLAPLLSIQMSNGAPSLSIVGSIGSTNRIEYSTELKSNSWQTLTNIILPSAPFIFTDPQAPLLTRRFYRVIRDGD